MKLISGSMRFFKNYSYGDDLQISSATSVQFGLAFSHESFITYGAFETDSPEYIRPSLAPFTPENATPLPDGTVPLPSHWGELNSANGTQVAGLDLSLIHI